MNTNSLTVRGFINKLGFNKGDGSDKKDSYFATVSYKSNGVTQYVSCLVAKPLQNLMRECLSLQAEMEEGKFSHPLSSTPAKLTIVDPTFIINNDGYLQGKGILTAILFEALEQKQKT